MSTTNLEKLSDEISALASQKAMLESTVETCLAQLEDTKSAIVKAETQVQNGIRQRFQRDCRRSLEHRARRDKENRNSMKAVVDYYEREREKACKRLKRYHQQLDEND